MPGSWPVWEPRLLPVPLWLAGDAVYAPWRSLLGMCRYLEARPDGGCERRADRHRQSAPRLRRPVHRHQDRLPVPSVRGVVARRNRWIAVVASTIFLAIALATGASYVVDREWGGVVFYVIFGLAALWASYRSAIGYEVRVGDDHVEIRRSFSSRRFRRGAIHAVGKARVLVGPTHREALWIETEGRRIVFSEFNQSPRRTGPVDRAVQAIEGRCTEGLDDAAPLN